MPPSKSPPSTNNPAGNTPGHPTPDNTSLMKPICTEGEIPVLPSGAGAAAGISRPKGNPLLRPRGGPGQPHGAIPTTRFFPSTRFMARNPPRRAHQGPRSPARTSRTTPAIITRQPARERVLMAPE
jgi:hypothetical protein